MASINLVLAKLIPLAFETTLSEGAIAIILDQDRSGIHIIVGYTNLNGMREGDEHVYCEAVRRHLGDSTKKVSKVITSKFVNPPKSLNGTTIVHSRHAAILYWEKGVWLYTKRGPALRLGLELGHANSGSQA